MSDTKRRDYFIGLDIGTNSVGWAVADETYHLMRAKGEDLIGFRLFDKAETATEKRLYRSNRRRLKRANSRLKLLRVLFRDEIAKVDPNFYLRLKESFYFAEDKNGLNHDKNTLFADDNYTDREFHAEFPTIWHLRQSLIEGKKRYDIRLYFLAIQHIIKHRGHFLFGGEIENIDDNFSALYQELVENCQNYITIDPGKAEEFQQILFSKSSKDDKKKQILSSIVVSADPENINLKTFPALFTGSDVSFKQLFKLDVEEDKKFSLNHSQVDEKIDDLANFLSVEQFEIVVTAKKIYDFILLKNILSGNANISAAMIKNYNKHKTELAELKEILRPHKEYYEEIFKSDTENSYNAYIGKSVGKGIISQEDLNKYLLKVLTKTNYTGRLLQEAEAGTLLPKQKGQAKGSIPMQLHRNELKKILANLGRDYPGFTMVNPSESVEYNTAVKKILQIHSFRIPYYCGPLVKGQYDKNGNLVQDGRSEFSWADEEIKQIVYPWNFTELVDLERRAENFIKRMTNECTYLLGEEVLPKSSISYQRFMVLNELNNLKINGVRISDVKIKQDIFERFFNSTDALAGNFKLKTFEKQLKKYAMPGIDEADEITGTNDDKYLPKLSTHLELVKILGQDYMKKYRISDIERVIEALTIIGEEKDMCQKKIRKILNCEEVIAKSLCQIKCREWANFSDKLLNQLKITIDERSMTVLEALYETNYNFMELMSRGLSEEIEKFNNGLDGQAAHDISYEDVKKLYCSPAVKRSVWQAAKIVNELTTIIGYPPKKIFIEVTRGSEDIKTKQQNNKMRMRRKEQLRAALKNSKEILQELNNTADEKFQIKKIFLYFMQHGICAYSGERLSLDDLSDCDIDHIYPRSLTKDDSLANNLVLVESKFNREKTNTYPIVADWRHRMEKTWRSWLLSGSITKEKFFRLHRSTPLTTEELSGFISRQLVETSQSAKAVAHLLKNSYADTDIITVKAGHISDLRKFFGYDKKTKAGQVYHKGRPEFIKIRELNDLHHAKDAYLNIVVGNVYHETFTANPMRWIKDRGNSDYTLSTDKLFRESEYYNRIADGQPTNNPKVKGWNFASSVETISQVMRKNGVLWTRMPITRSGQISDLQPVPKSQDRLPLKQTKRLSNTERYGGYNSIKGAYFSLIDFEDARGKTIRKIVQIPIISQDVPLEYLSKKYQNPKIIIDKILINSLLKVDGAPLHLIARTGDSLKFTHAKQLRLETELYSDLKKILKISENIKFYKKNKLKYKIPEAYGINKTNTSLIYHGLLRKLDEYRQIPTLGGKTDEIASTQDDFDALDINDQCELIAELLNVFACSKKTSDLSRIVSKSAHIAGNGIVMSSNISNREDIKLIHQSITGLVTKVIDLRKIQ